MKCKIFNKFNRKEANEFSYIKEERGLESNIVKKFSNTNFKLFFIMIIPILFLLIMPLISSLGISPGRTTLNFEDSLEREVSVSVINTENKDMEVTLYAKGELKDKVELKEDKLFFSENEKEKTFSYNLKFPKDFELTPGLHTAEIVALEVPEGAGEEGAVIGATVAVISQLYVHVPYPGKYIDCSLDILEEEETVSFYIPITNRGKQNINSIESSIEIYSGTEVVKKIEIDPISLESGRREELIAKWQDAEFGDYNAKLTLNYDGNEKIIEKNFKVGTLKLEIEVITVDDFTLGEIAKFNFLVKNNWPEEIKDVSVQMIVYAEEGNILADFKSVDYDIPAKSRTNIIAYWDTKKIEKGLYDSKVILIYEGEEYERNVKIKVNENSIEVLGLTGYVIEEGGEEFNLVNLLLIIVGLLIIANIVWFVIVKKLKKKKK